MDIREYSEWTYDSSWVWCHGLFDNTGEYGRRILIVTVLKMNLLLPYCFYFTYYTLYIPKNI